MSESVLLNVSALPPVRVAESIARTSAELGGRGGLFTVDGVRHRPHLTLFMARFPAAAAESVRDSVAALATKAEGVRAEHTGFHLTPGHYYEASYRRTDALMALHFSVMRELAPLRFSPGAPVVEDYFAPYTDAQRASATEWGYDLAGDLYRPHVTITRFAAIPTGPLPELREDLSFEVTTLALSTADDHGATDHLIDEFRTA